MSFLFTFSFGISSFDIYAGFLLIFGLFLLLKLWLVGPNEFQQFFGKQNQIFLVALRSKNIKGLPDELYSHDVMYDSTIVKVCK